MIDLHVGQQRRERGSIFQHGLQFANLVSQLDLPPAQFGFNLERDSDSRRRHTGNASAGYGAAGIKSGHCEEQTERNRFAKDHARFLRSIMDRSKQGDLQSNRYWFEKTPITITIKIMIRPDFAEASRLSLG